MANPRETRGRKAKGPEKKYGSQLPKGKHETQAFLLTHVPKRECFWAVKKSFLFHGHPFIPLSRRLSEHRRAV
jgi:hypothetical protein